MSIRANPGVSISIALTDGALTLAGGSSKYSTPRAQRVTAIKTYVIGGLESSGRGDQQGGQNQGRSRSRQHSAQGQQRDQQGQYAGN